MHAPEEYLCVFVTAPTLTVARKLAASAVSGRLAACANLLPKIESHYWWEGNLESSSEVLILFKTTADKVADLESNIVSNHPYNTPEFVVLKIDRGNEKYLNWIAASVHNKS